MSAARGSIAALVAALLGAAGPLAAQGSVFGVRGVGVPGRPVSAWDAGLAGGFGAVDAAGFVNPAALGRWRGLAGWAVGAPSFQTFTGREVEASLRATRFPLFGFASRIRERLAVGVAIGDYLDRNWSVVIRDTIVLRGDTVEFTDGNQSLGGVSDMRFAAAYHLSDRVVLGAALHALVGSARQSVQRNFDSDVLDDYLEVSNTDYRGAGVSAGVFAQPSQWLDLGASARFSGTLTARNTAGAKAGVALPAQLAVGAAVRPAPGLNAGGTLEFAGWSRASDDLTALGHAPARDTWSLGLGFDVQRVRLLLFSTPLRIGYRWRQLPIQVEGSWLGEHAVSAGIGLSMAQGRTTVDAGFESGARRAGDLKETFRTLFIGVTVRP